MQIPSYLTPPFPDNFAFFVLNANETLRFYNSPDFRDSDYGSAIWERVAWFLRSHNLDKQSGVMDCGESESLLS
jgi:hypothetical protein